MGKLIDVDKFLERVKKDREHEIYLHSWTADMVLERLDSWYAPTVEAIPKDQYETRLKADMAAMLTELKTEIDIMSDSVVEGRTVTITSWSGMKKRIRKLIQSKIDKLKENTDGTDHT